MKASLSRTLRCSMRTCMRIMGMLFSVCYILVGHNLSLSACDIFFGTFIGIPAALYVFYAIYFFFFRHVERDIILLRKSFVMYVVIFVIAIPLAIASVMIILNTSPSQLFVDNAESTHHATTQQSESPHILWYTYYHFVDPGNQHDTTTSGKVFTGLLAILGMLLFNGLMVTTLISWIDKRKEDWKQGKIRYKLRHLPAGKFAIVIGANEIAASVIKNLLQPKAGAQTLDCLSDKENDCVILQTSSDVQQVRDVLSSHLSHEDMDKVIIYNALRDSKDEIEYLYLEHATEIYILGENTTVDGGETYHDTMNMRCLNLMAEHLNNQNYKKSIGHKRKVCRVMFDYQTTYSVFQFSDVSDAVKNTLVFIPFNRYESWARKVLVDCVAENHGKIIKYTPLDGFEGIKYEDDKRVHLVIVGMSKMGIAMGVQALLQLHFPNYIRNKDLKTRVTFIDTNADKEMAFFKGRYATLFELARHRYIDANECASSEVNSDYNWIDPMQLANCQWKHLSQNGDNFMDVEVEFIKGELESDGVRNYLKEISNNEQNSKLTIAICLTQTHQAVAAALYMPIEVYNCPNLQQILVYQREADDIVANLLNVKDTSIRYSKLLPFGMLYGEYMETRRRYIKAQLVNMAYSNLRANIPWPTDVLNKKDVGTEFMKKEWSRLAISYRISNKFFGDTIYQKLRSMISLPAEQAIGGYQNVMYDNALLYDTLSSTFCLKLPIVEEEHINKPAYYLAQCEHNRWNLEKLLMGFSPMNKEQDKRFRQLVEQKDKDAIKQLKNQLKSSAANIHPNICDFHHLEDIDQGAQEYDIILHNAIPYILLLVDGYMTVAGNTALIFSSPERNSKENKRLTHCINQPRSCPPHHS